MSANVGLSRSTTSRILHEQQLRAYHYSPAQNLLPGDFLARMQFCEFILRRNRQDAYFVNKILFTDEATFTRRGIFNKKNCHIWADQKPIGPFCDHYDCSVRISRGILGIQMRRRFSVRLYRVLAVRYRQLRIHLKLVPFYKFLLDGSQGSCCSL
ncbi:hypothetical protein NQ318_016605 [Aromia moschata]|uniref:Transposase n=1 Tax=Aromia moschata TaxID=1265417 RepID=A0AAV8XZA9_9CUCU|nr:hypothetical protein NQ318_016605 [Aromia moschata]